MIGTILLVLAGAFTMFMVGAVWAKYNVLSHLTWYKDDDGSIIVEYRGKRGRPLQ